MKKKMLIIFLCALSTWLHAQNEPPQKKLGAWYILASKSKISENIQVQLQTQFRFYELTNDMQQLMVRTGITYKTAPNFILGIGYAYFNNDPSYRAETPDSFNEHRLVLDGHLSQKIAKIGIKHRYRLEHRFIEDRDNSSWLRYMIKASYPLTEKLKLDIYDEVFLNLTEEQTFSQNWLGTGVSYTISDIVKGSVGFQHIQTPGPDFSRVLIGITFSPDFTKTKI